MERLLIAFVLASLLWAQGVLAFPSVGKEAVVPPAPDLKILPLGVSLRFYCWWWSEAAEERWTPQHSPSYDEYIEFEEWVFTDGPKPKAFDILVDIKNQGDEDLEGLYVDLLYQWKIGPIGDAEKSEWEDPQLFHDEIIHYLPAGASRQVKVDQFTIWDKQESLPIRSWTWALKITCKVRRIERVRKVSADQKVEFTVERVLPIIPGD